MEDACFPPHGTFSIVVVVKVSVTPAITNEDPCSEAHALNKSRTNFPGAAYKGLLLANINSTLFQAAHEGHVILVICA